MSSTPKKYRFHSVFLFFRRRSALTFLFRYPKFLLNFSVKFFQKIVDKLLFPQYDIKCVWQTDTKQFTYARVAQLVEHDLAKVGAAGSSPVSRSSLNDGKLWLQGFPFFYCNVKINYTFLLITQCFFKAFLRICEWGFRLNLLCFHSDPHITDIHQMNGLNFHLSNHFHPLFSIFNFFLYHFGRNSFISAVFTLTF